MAPVVSIVTPAYNAAAHIAETISSVIAQTFPDWEMLIVDDCSRDKTVEVIDRFASLDSRVRLIKQRENGGPAAARQRGLDAAQGRYIAFLDSDDVWLPSKLERQLEFMRRHDAALSYTAYRRVSQDGSVVGRLIDVPESLGYSDLLKNTAIATSTAMVDKEKTGPFSMTRTYYDDFALWLQLLRRGHVAFGLREDLMRYRVMARSVSRNKGRSAYWVWRTYRDIEKLNPIRAAWCFGHYAWHALGKYAKF
jgi:teichuronic acid biosynthesis glycosyltransferase TuaG